jgi:hypothetical protein
MTETPHNLLQKSTPVYTEPAFEKKKSIKSYYVEQIKWIEEDNHIEIAFVAIKI